MKSIFATVGTTSFDDFVQSLCSLPFLTAMARHHRPACHPHDHDNETKETSSVSASLLSSSHSPSASSSYVALSARGPSLSSCSTSSSSSSPCTARGKNDMSLSLDTLDLTIQYGKGQCPLSFLPPSLLNTPAIQRNDDNNNDSSGSVILSIPIDSNDVPGTCRSTPSDKATTQQNQRVRVRWYRFQPSLSTEMERADVILCHAGAGTLLEALAISSSTSTPRQKIVNAVINSKLMDNHQTELADELENRNHICVTRDCTSEWATDDGPTTFWKNIEVFLPVPFMGGLSSGGTGQQNQGDSNQQFSSFQKIVDQVMGFQEIWAADDSTKKTR